MSSERGRIWGFHSFFLLITLVAFRHFFIEGDYLWTNEGSRLSWNMRLRATVCLYELKLNDGKWEPLNLKDLSPWQIRDLVDPYFMRLYLLKTQCGPANRVYAQATCRAAGHVPAPLIRNDINLCQTEYHFLKHNEWIHPFPGALDPSYKAWLNNPRRTLYQ